MNRRKALVLSGTIAICSTTAAASILALRQSPLEGPLGRWSSAGELVNNPRTPRTIVVLDDASDGATPTDGPGAGRPEAGSTDAAPTTSPDATAPPAPTGARVPSADSTANAGATPVDAGGSGAIVPSSGGGTASGDAPAAGTPTGPVERAPAPTTLRTTPTATAAPPPSSSPSPTTTVRMTTTTRPAGIPDDWPAGVPIPPKPANCRDGVLEKDGHWNCQH